MKNVFKILLVIIFVGMLVIPQCFAGSYKSNIYASWLSVTASRTIDFPYKSREVTIMNGSAIDIYVDLKGNVIPANGDNSVGINNTVFQINGTDSLTLQDFITESVSLKSATGVAASPVSIIVTY